MSPDFMDTRKILKSIRGPKYNTTHERQYKNNEADRSLWL